MKVVFNKRLEAGKYYVNIDVTDYTHDEVDKIKRFGAPLISLSPQNAFKNGNFVTHLPIHSLNYDFQFSTEAQAKQFVDSLSTRIQVAVKELKARKDDFSGKKELDL